MTLGEDRLVQWFEDQIELSPVEVPIGIGDDMAEVSTQEASSVFFATDMLVEHTHFDLATASLEQVGYKAMAVNLSDCAAMATLPLAAVVAVALPVEFTESQLKDVYAGLLGASRTYRCPIVGGDTTRSMSAAPLVLNVSILSRCRESRAITRSRAQVGDVVCVTGSLGGSLVGKHLCFRPRLQEALSLAEGNKITAMLDISDGLSTDLARLCRRSKTGALIDASKIPISDQARTREDPLGSALHEGEDFELLFTLPPEDYQSLEKRWDHATPITQIGTITDSCDIAIRLAEDQVRPLAAEGYDHFKRDRSPR